MAETKAVIFTHIGFKGLLDPAGFDAFYARHGPLFESCLACQNVGIVFVYVSYGIEEYVRTVMQSKTTPVTVPFTTIEGEERIFNALHMAEEKAGDNLIGRSGSNFAPSQAPKFVFVGVRELASLLHKLWLRNPELVTYLAGQGTFTYDSPKFVEAVIRIARGKNDHARHPILRVDADVEVNPDAIQMIIEQDERFRMQGFPPYWWFSGHYSGNFSGDPVNEYAVRQHWLIDPSTWGDPSRFTLLPGAETFLRDLGEFGATQVDSAINCSAACEALFRRRSGPRKRPTAQVISGAGLVASLAAIRRLPPFMNASEMIIWIDDHLKRQLHEAIGDIALGAPERIVGAKLRQNRHPEGIALDEIPADYFQRVLRGCLMHATIKQPTDKPGPLAEWVRQVVVTGVRNDLSSNDDLTLKNELITAAIRQYNDVLKVWRNADYGNSILKDWADKLTPTNRRMVCSAIAEVGVSYVKLLLRWPQYVFAIEDLGPLEAYWLFTRVR